MGLILGLVSFLLAAMAQGVVRYKEDVWTVSAVQFAASLIAATVLAGLLGPSSAGSWGLERMVPGVLVFWFGLICGLNILTGRALARDKPSRRDE